MKKLIFVSIVIVFVFHTSAQIGKHGNLTVTTANRVVNEYTTLAANASTGNTSILVASNTLNANGRFSGPLQAGDLVMIIQMSGVNINAWSHPDPMWSQYSFPVDSTWGAITAYNNCGNYEFAEVYSVSGPNTINLVCGLKNNYTATGKVQVIRVPRYINLTVNNAASITCDPWNGTSGGVVAVEAQTNVNVLSGGSIHANERGFRGGEALLNSSNTGGGQYGHSSDLEGAEKGEGVYGFQNEYSNVSGRYCRGAGANAGGGGDNHNAGGGGGGNGGNPAAWNGHGNPDVSGANWTTAWNLEWPGFATNTSTGGGRGGYTFSQSNQNAIAVGPGNSAWGGDYRRQVGGLGGRPLDYSTGRIFLGGGGGAGSQNNSYGGDGGNGGGIVYILGYGTVTGAGTITSNGEVGENSQGSAPIGQWAGVDGSGGGGAGGTIIINTESTVSGVSITASGGNGGNQVKSQGAFAPANTEAEGPGGGGGGGYIAISSGTPTRTANGGANGITNSTGLSEFTPNGATRGGNGTNNASITPTTLTVSNVNACIGDDITITATLGGSVPGGTQVVWWDAAVAGTSVHTGTTYTINNASNSDTLWVGFCPGWYREQVIITVSGPVCVASGDTTICEGGSAQLNASGGVSYAWSSGSSLDNPGIANPVATPATTTLYYVTATEGVCESIDSVLVTVNPQMDATITSGTAYCSNDASVPFTAVDGGGTWTGNGISSGGVFDPVAAGAGVHEIIYTIAGMCGDTDTLDVTVFAAPIVNLGADTTICDGTTLQLDAGAGYTNYNWNPAGSNQTYDVTTSGTYNVTVTDANTCLGTDQITVTVVTQMDATITSGTAYCSNDASVSFTAVDGGGTWSGNGISAGGVFDPVAAGAGVHEIVYTIAGMCGDTDTLDVTVFAAPIVNLGADTTICDGTTLQLDAGAGYTNYNWNPAGSNQTYDVTTSGTYNVTVTDANTCLGTDQITVTVVTQMDATITSGTDYCSNDASVSFTAVDGGGTWSGNGISAGGVFDPVAAGAGVHEIIYTIPSACGDADTVNINVFAAPVVNLGADTTLCDGSSLVLDAGAGYSTYNWTPAGSNQTYTVNSSGTYQVTVTDVNNCGGSDEITISYIPQADASITAPAEFCSNDSPVNFTATDPGGIWSGNGIINTSSGTFDPSTAGAGTHSVIYTISGICGDADTVYVDVHAAPEPDLGSITQICEDSSYTLDAGSGYVSYNWSPSGNSQTINVTTGGTYSVTVTDSNGCSGSTSITMTVEPWADATITPSGPWCDNDAALTLTAAENGGVWSGNGVSSSGIFDPSAAGSGNHQIIYTIAGPCGDNDTTDILVNESPLLTIIVTPETCAGSNDALIELSISGGSSPYDVMWNNGATSLILENLIPGTYSVVVTDSNTCSKTTQETVIAATNDCFASHVFLPNVFSPNGDGENDVLYVRGEGIQYLELIIFNRWGEKIFETTDQQKGWDGTYKGMKVEAGVYSYILTAEFSGNVTKKLQGTVTVVY